MKVLVVGGGGREHAIVMKLSESPLVTELYCAPGNGGIAKYATCCPVKATDLEGMLALAKKDGKPVSDYELSKISLLHGRAAAVMMKEKFGITDKDILEAVANHVSGCLGLCDLGKILFLADKTEPGRPQSTDEYRAGLIKLTLDEQFLSVIK